jgi:D-glycero-alpha-D-manno-heptose-7-phosphate kinase
MIITQTPLRISFLGGGSDFPEFYFSEPGCVLSATIDKYVNVIVKRRFDDLIRVGYTKQEVVESVDDLEHELVREAMRITGIEKGIEIATMADVPGRGSGLGSSSAVSAGLLHAMWLYQGWLPTRDMLAEGACEIELDLLGRPIGKQDQYAVAYGGLNFIEFTREGVSVEPVAGNEALARRLGERLMLFFTGITRRSADVLVEQRAAIEDKREQLRDMAQMARDGRKALESGRLDDVGGLMHEGWQLKRRLASRITTPEIDEAYEAARNVGAIGGKISGAGGGGFMLIYCPPQHHDAVRTQLTDRLGMTELEFSLESGGSLVMLHSRRP